MNAQPLRLKLYSRDYCHLCHDMRAALEALRGELPGPFAVEVVDVDADPALLARYDELVPVLVVCAAHEEREVCHYFLDRQAVVACFDQGRAA